MLSNFNVGRQAIQPQPTLKRPSGVVVSPKASLPGLRFGMNHDTVTISRNVPGTLTPAQYRAFQLHLAQSMLANDEGEAFNQLIQQRNAPLSRQSLEWAAEFGQPDKLDRILDKMAHRPDSMSHYPNEADSQKLQKLARSQQARINKLKGSIGISGWLFPDRNPKYRQEMIQDILHSPVSTPQKEIAKKRELLALLQAQAPEAGQATEILGTAMRYGHNDIAVALSKIPGIEINEAPLEHAIQSNNPELMEAILAFPELNVNQFHKTGETLLNIAIEGNKQESLKSLLNVPGIEVNKPNEFPKTYEFKDKSNYTPLQTAIRNHNYDALKLLLKKPALNVDHTDLHLLAQQHAQTAADKEAHLKAFSMLKRRVPDFIDSRDSQGNSILHSAAIGGNTRLINKLIPLMPNSSLLWINNNQQNVLHLAISNYQTDAANLFLDKIGHASIAGRGLVVNQRNKWAETILHDAARIDRHNLVERLLDIPGINVNARNSGGKTPAEVAMDWNFSELVRSICQHPDMDPIIRQRLINRLNEQQMIDDAMDSWRRSNETSWDTGSGDYMY